MRKKENYKYKETLGNLARLGKLYDVDIESCSRAQWFHFIAKPHFEGMYKNNPAAMSLKVLEELLIENKVKDFVKGTQPPKEKSHRGRYESLRNLEEVGRVHGVNIIVDATGPRTRYSAVEIFSSSSVSISAKFSSAFQCF